MTDLTTLDLIVKRKGGGSIIDQRPLFSSDGETMYIIWKHVIRVYSTQTGDFVKEFEVIDHKIAGIILHPESPTTIIGCTDNAELSYWNCQNGIVTKKLRLKTKGEEQLKAKTFHIVRYKTSTGQNIFQVLITNISKPSNFINIALFDLTTGNCIKSTSIQNHSEEYYIDVIGNYEDNLIALLHDSDLHILSPARNLTDKLHKTGKTGRLPTCIAGHPREECVATGDSTGRVVVWRNLFQNRPYTASYHWHTLPVTEIAFSFSGGHMYTGGGECVLVKWTLNNPLQKSFLPRLPAPIKHLTIAPNNIYVAVSTLDNGIVVVNPQRKLTSMIQSFTWGVALSSKDLFPAGLIVDPRTNSLVLNSRTGHVQFYDTHTKSLLYNINITAQNFLTQERSVIIVNTEVTKIALNYNGKWMATVEERNDKISNTEVRLKFWNFDNTDQIYKLNTSIELPHENGVNTLQFQPNTFPENTDCLAVTTGRDKKFKLWNLAQSASIYKKTKHWHCYSVGDYRHLSVTDADFSMDGSLLGIGFDSSLTIWSPDNCTLKCSLSNTCYPYTITRIKFGRNEACHLVVVGSAKHIAVWDLLSLRLIWSVPLKLATLTADPKSIYMAAFTTDNTVYIFSPKCPTPVYEKKNIIDNDSLILGASFVPHLKEKQDPSFKKWQQKSQLYFLDSNQELLTLEPESEISVCLEILSNNSSVPATAFAKLMADQTFSSKEEKQQYLHEYLGVSGKGMTQELLSVPAHTLPPTSLICASFILSLVAEPSKKVSLDTTDDRNDNANNEEKTTEKDENVEMFKQSFSEPLTDGDSQFDESITSFKSIDWEFLSNILPEKENVES
ncbi:WD repeat-containing protein 75 [Prorops nasuta]|uniref:WD repeat-containing protein 75 n=1 Tax=Prorops nasuta TaxID=863751 RepID=UPI0034CE9767